MNTTDKYLACPEHHSGITRVRLNPEYVAPLPKLGPLLLRAFLLNLLVWFVAIACLSSLLTSAIIMVEWVLS